MTHKKIRAEGHYVRYLYVLPLIILMIAVFIYPIIMTVIYSFQKLSLGQYKGSFVGFDNYISLLSDPVFKKTLVNSMIWTFGNLILQSLFAQLIANLLNAKFKGRNLTRTAVLLPWIIPGVSIALVLRWVLLPGIGIVNDVLLKIGILSQPVEFLGRNYAMASLIVLGSWKYTPIGVLLVLSALQTIPSDVYEAAQIDGANKWQQFTKVTFPIIGKMLGFTTFLIFVLNFNTFDLIWMVLQGGPGDATQTLPILVYRYAFKMVNLGSSSAVSIVIAVILGIVGILYFKSASKGEKNEY